ncbi:hypothetical protein RIR_jg22399.t1 [Rhizophagus irregularis DAOM 181602=DAOM 197198]|nr:hypothetical protein RIR_jg22399.t1 [Rhizophagus irregularis DAOM 181602=DAOM 197198]
MDTTKTRHVYLYSVHLYLPIPFPRYVIYSPPSFSASSTLLLSPCSPMIRFLPSLIQTVSVSTFSCGRRTTCSGEV